MIHDDIAKRILILDGAMGTVIQEYGLDEPDFRGQLFAQQPGQLKGDNDVLNLTRPDVITDIHERYLRAGADIISTNTFNAQRISQADYQLQAYARDMSLAGARLARQAADRFSTPEKHRYVAGSIGPTNKTCSMSPDVSDPARRELTYDQLFTAYTEQAEALIEGGADMLLIETIFDTLNAKCAIHAAMHAIEQTGRTADQIPILLSATISDAAGRTLSGQTLDAFLASVSSFPIFSVGLNCSFGASQMKPYLRELARHSHYYISAHPNAGLPNALGCYDETPDTMAPQIAAFIDEGLVNIVGGCCGTTPAFIEKYVPLAEGKPPRTPSARPTHLTLSGLDPLEVSAAHFTTVGERCNVAGSRKFLRLIKEKNYDEALLIARKQVDDGALVIDINMDDGLLDAKAEMVHFLNLIAAEPDIARVPIMIDSSDWNVVVAGLKCIQGKGIVNSISLKEGEDTFLSHARDVQRLGAAVVVMCFDEQGQATTYERRIAIAERSYRLLTAIGFPPEDIIFDPNILAIATGMAEHDAYALDFIRATRWICENLPGAHVSGGVSNLSFAFRGNNYIREAMHAVFLHHAVKAGMDFGIVNPAAKLTCQDIPQDQLDIFEDAILNRRNDAAERLTELAFSLGEKGDSSAGAKGVKGDKENLALQATTGGAKDNSGAQEGGAKDNSGEPYGAPSAHSSSAAEHLSLTPLTPEKLSSRLSDALVRGDTTTLEADLREALTVWPRAVDIIEGPLMAGMKTVGERFGAGKMFLPQVVKTARTMKQAVSILQPFIEAQNDGKTAAAGKILLATVKGDVHDIGKNIVGVILACNGYEVIDMGVMVPADDIVAKAIAENVDMIGLSGLITPSLEEMVNVATQLKNAGLNIPIMIGGATTSELHVALKIAPVYGGPVVWMKDASQNALVASQLISDKDAVAQELDQRYQQLRQGYRQEQQQLLTLAEARRKKTDFFADHP